MTASWSGSRSPAPICTVCCIATQPDTPDTSVAKTRQPLFFGDRAIAAGFISPDQLQHCLRQQTDLIDRRQLTMIGELLVRAGFMTPRQVLSVLQQQGIGLSRSQKGRQYNIPYPEAQRDYKCSADGSKLQLLSEANVREVKVDGLLHPAMGGSTNGAAAGGVVAKRPSAAPTPRVQVAPPGALRPAGKTGMPAPVPGTSPRKSKSTGVHSDQLKAATRMLQKPDAGKPATPAAASPAASEPATTSPFSSTTPALASLADTRTVLPPGKSDASRVQLPSAPPGAPVPEDATRMWLDKAMPEPPTVDMTRANMAAAAASEADRREFGVTEDAVVDEAAWDESHDADVFDDPEADAAFDETQAGTEPLPDSITGFGDPGTDTDTPDDDPEKGDDQAAKYFRFADAMRQLSGNAGPGRSDVQIPAIPQVSDVDLASFSMGSRGADVIAPEAGAASGEDGASSAQISTAEEPPSKKWTGDTVGFNKALAPTGDLDDSTQRDLYRDDSTDPGSSGVTEFDPRLVSQRAIGDALHGLGHIDKEFLELAWEEFIDRSRGDDSVSFAGVLLEQGYATMDQLDEARDLTVMSEETAAGFAIMPGVDAALDGGGEDDPWKRALAGLEDNPHPAATSDSEIYGETRIDPLDEDTAARERREAARRPTDPAKSPLQSDTTITEFVQRGDLDKILDASATVLKSAQDVESASLMALGDAELTQAEEATAAAETDLQVAMDAQPVAPPEGGPDAATETPSAANATPTPVRAKSTPRKQEPRFRAFVSDVNLPVFQPPAEPKTVVNSAARIPDAVQDDEDTVIPGSEADLANDWGLKSDDDGAAATPPPSGFVSDVEIAALPRDFGRSLAKPGAPQDRLPADALKEPLPSADDDDDEPPTLPDELMSDAGLADDPGRKPLVSDVELAAFGAAVRSGALGAPKDKLPPTVAREPLPADDDDDEPPKLPDELMSEAGIADDPGRKPLVSDVNLASFGSAAAPGAPKDKLPPRVADEPMQSDAAVATPPRASSSGSSWATPPMPTDGAATANRERPAASGSDRAPVVDRAALTALPSAAGSDATSAPDRVHDEPESAGAAPDDAAALAAQALTRMRDDDDDDMSDLPDVASLVTSPPPGEADAAGAELADIAETGTDVDSDDDTVHDTVDDDPMDLADLSDSDSDGAPELVESPVDLPDVTDVAAEDEDDGPAPEPDRYDAKKGTSLIGRSSRRYEPRTRRIVPPVPDLSAMRLSNPDELVPDDSERANSSDYVELDEPPVDLEDALASEPMNRPEDRSSDSGEYALLQNETRFVMPDEAGRHLDFDLAPAQASTSRLMPTQVDDDASDVAPDAEPATAADPAPTGTSGGADGWGSDDALPKAAADSGSEWSEQPASGDRWYEPGMPAAGTSEDALDTDTVRAAAAAADQANSEASVESPATVAAAPSAPAAPAPVDVPDSVVPDRPFGTPPRTRVLQRDGAPAPAPASNANADSDDEADDAIREAVAEAQAQGATSWPLASIPNPAELRAMLPALDTDSRIGLLASLMLIAQSNRESR